MRILTAYANKVLAARMCESVTNGDKNKQGRYFITCGNEYQNRYFSAADVK